ncbi:MAG: cysteine hydrolase [Rhodospirillaceae bacterium]|nr:cysteine hydrolase [Rhodospirillaceae bacterium]
MTTPKTLLDLAGVAALPSSWRESILIVIDAQNEYVGGPLALAGIDPALDAVADLLARARRAGAPIIHIRHRGSAGGAFDLDAARGQIVDRVAPAPGERIIDKPLPNAFANTDLAAAVETAGRRSLIVCGFMTHMCISSTVRAALNLGYRCTVPASATATRALPDPVGGMAISAAAIQQATLAALSDRFATVVGGPSAIPG